MMNHPLLIFSMLERAAKFFPGKEIISRCPDRDFSYTYADFFRRVCRLANGLKKLGIQKGDRMATFAWNTHRHLELYFAVTCSGAVLHTLNIRLFADHLTYIINHAEDKVIFVDEDLIPTLEVVADRLKTVQQFVVMTGKEALPETKLAPALSYERLLAGVPDSYDFPEDLDENTLAALCYTSATTGLPKGVTYTHRSIYLHALTLAVPDSIGIAEGDVILAVVPMFHVFSWGFPFTAAWMGSKLVLPGKDLAPENLCRLIEKEKVTLMAGVPTIWINIFQHLESGARYDLSSLRFALNGGAPISPSLVENLEKKWGITVRGTCGMTEASPVVLTCPMQHQMADWDEARKFAQQAKQGLLLPGLQMKVVNDTGQEIKWDGKEMGELLLKGPWIAAGYYRDQERSAVTFKEGWYHSGDIVTVDEYGYLLIQDRIKDLIKSGGEWISSVELENKIMAHPAVVEAAVVAMPHAKWQERPLAYVVLKPNRQIEVGETEIIEFLKDKVAIWWLPDKVVFLEEIPKTSVGKFNKKALRELSRIKNFS